MTKADDMPKTEDDLKVQDTTTEIDEHTGLPDIFSDDDLSVLTKEEISEIRKMEAEDKAEEESAAKSQDMSDADDADDDDGADTNDDQPQVEDKKPEEKPEPAEPALSKVPDVSEAHATVKQGQEDLDTLRQEWEDGDLSDKDYATKRAELEDTIIDAKSEIKAADRIAADNEAADKNRWVTDVNAFFEDNPVLKTDEHIQAYDDAVKAVTADPTNASLTNQQCLILAARQYKAKADIIGKPFDLNAGVKAKKEKEPTDQDPQKEKAEPKFKARTDAREDPPVTLANVPQTDTQSGADGRFANIDRAIDDDPFAGEDAFSRMSPADQERYLTGA